MKENDKKPIEIKPIKIETLSTDQGYTSPKVVKAKPIDILSKLKVATKVSTEGIVLSKEEVSNKVLDSLKKTIARQEIEELVIAQPIVKKIVKKRIIAKKIKVTKKKRIIKKKKSIKKRKVITNKKIIKTKRITKKTTVTKKKTIIANTKVVENPTTSQKRNSNLTREEEVALYHEKYASTLEVVNVTKPFEIKEKKSIPDAYYFEPQKTIETKKSNTPLKFVKKLGVVAVSNTYETPLIIPKKVEVAKEGIVNLPNTSLETEEMKKLKFVDTLGVVEVSKDFETIEANKYLK